MTDAEILALLDMKRAHHPELRRRLSWPGLQRVCAREDVALFVRPHAEPAQLVGFDGAWGIIVDAQLPLRRHTYFAAHELAHLWLHVDEPAGSGSGRHAVVYNFGGYGTSRDVREDDAELLATFMCQGPRFPRP